MESLEGVRCVCVCEFGGVEKGEGGVVCGVIERSKVCVCVSLRGGG